MDALGGVLDELGRRAQGHQLAQAAVASGFGDADDCDVVHGEDRRRRLGELE